MARRDKEPFTTTAQLNRLVDEVVPQAHRPAGNPAKRVFQALRIEVNGELDKLASTLPQARTDCMSGDDWWWSPIIRSKTKPSNRSWHKGCEWMFRLACLSYRRMPNRFSRISREVPSRPTNMKSQPTRDRLRVRLRAVEVSREIPSRWRKRFTQTAQGLNDVKIQGSAVSGQSQKHGTNSYKEGITAYGNCT